MRFLESNINDVVGAMNFWDSNVWNMLIHLGILALVILLSNILRRNVKFIRESLIPTPVLGGIILLIFKLIPWVNDQIDETFMEMLTYHMLGLGFLAVAIKRPTKKEKVDDNKMVAMDTGLITVATYLIQAVVGLGLTILLAVTFMPDLFHACGILLPMGYGQGTGQALNFGGIFEERGFVGGKSFGLTVAAIGFLVACVIGVIYMNYLKRKGKLKFDEIEKKSNEIDMDEVHGVDDLPLTESMDKLTVQVCIILVGYLLTFLLMLGFDKLAVNFMGDFGTKTVRPLVWGFNFIFASIVGVVMKKGMFILKSKNIMKRHYPNNFLLNRISGLFFDIMIISGIAAINLNNLGELFIPLVVICVVGAIVTFIYVKMICYYTYPNYKYEAFFAMFGMLTGTASTGMALLKEIDPKLETPAANNLVIQQFPAILFGFPLLLLIPYSANSITTGLIVLGIASVMFVAYNAILLRKKIFKKKNKQE